MVGSPPTVHTGSPIMAQPSEYNRQYNFTNRQATNPDDPLPADQVDAELNAIKVTLDEIRARIALIQRDDGALANDSVGDDQLATALEIGFNPPRAWATATAYVADNNYVYVDGKLYLCIVSHTSGTFATDLAADKWDEIIDFNAQRFLAGYRFVFDGATTDGDPGAGKFRFDNAAVASATKLFVDNEDSFGRSATAWLDSFDDSASTVKGHVWVEEIANPAVYALFEVTGSVADDTGYRDVSVTYVDHSGTFVAGRTYGVHFTRAGDVGSLGQQPDGGSVDDTNSNELLEFGVVASAVNHVKVTNAATGSSPSVSAVGGDTNIDLVLVPKGTGAIVPDADGTRDLGSSSVRWAEVHVDTVLTDLLRGATTAGSLPVQGEGTATTNLQQGLAKLWALLNGTGTIALRDSYNVSSTTDVDTGRYNFGATNAMANANYVARVDGDFAGGALTDAWFGVNSYANNTGSSVRANIVNANDSYADSAYVSVIVNGDLA